MSEHESCIGASDEWYTPPEVFKALAVRFDLDVASPGDGRDFVPADVAITAEQDGLSAPWQGFVWMNPPFGGRRGQVPWLRRFFEHGDGIALVAARTSADWFHEFAPMAAALHFPEGKTKFIRPDGTRGGSPGTGVVLMAAGRRALKALDSAQRSGFGLTVEGRV